MIRSVNSLLKQNRHCFMSSQVLASKKLGIGEATVALESKIKDIS